MKTPCKTADDRRAELLAAGRALAVYAADDLEDLLREDVPREVARAARSYAR